MTKVHGAFCSILRGGLVCTSRTYQHVLLLEKPKKHTFGPFVWVHFIYAICAKRKSDLTDRQEVGGGGEIGIAIWTVDHLSLIQLSRETSVKKAENGMGSIFICVHSFFWERGGWKPDWAFVGETKERQCIIPTIYTVYLLKSLLKVHP